MTFIALIIILVSLLHRMEEEKLEFHLADKLYHVPELIYIFCDSVHQKASFLLHSTVKNELRIDFESVCMTF